MVLIFIFLCLYTTNIYHSFPFWPDAKWQFWKSLDPHHLWGRVSESPWLKTLPLHLTPLGDQILPLSSAHASCPFCQPPGTCASSYCTSWALCIWGTWFHFLCGWFGGGASWNSNRQTTNNKAHIDLSKWNSLKINWKYLVQEAMESSAFPNKIKWNW